MGTASTVAGMGIALYVSLEAYNQGGLFAWHPFCMSLGALGLSTAGIQAVRSRRTAEGLQAKTRRVQVYPINSAEESNALCVRTHSMCFVKSELAAVLVRKSASRTAVLL